MLLKFPLYKKNFRSKHHQNFSGLVTGRHVGKKNRTYTQVALLIKSLSIDVGGGQELVVKAQPDPTRQIQLTCSQ